MGYPVVKNGNRASFTGAPDWALLLRRKLRRATFAFIGANAVLMSIGWIAAAKAKDILIEFLQSRIDSGNISFLEGLACRNYDKLVHIDVGLNWPAGMSSSEGRMIFSDETAEYLFPQANVNYLHGEYIIKGYFIVRSGGTHQGVSSIAFEKVSDAIILTNPSVRERKVRSSKCRF